MLQDSLPLGAAAWGFFVDREGRVLASTHADVSVGELPDFASALQTGVADVRRVLAAVNRPKVSITGTNPQEITAAFNVIEVILNEEKRARPAFNIWLDTGVQVGSLATGDAESLAPGYGATFIPFRPNQSPGYKCCLIVSLGDKAVRP